MAEGMEKAGEVTPVPFAMVREAVEAQWGKRCPDFCPDCVVCQAWSEFDELMEGVGG